MIRFTFFILRITKNKLISMNLGKQKIVFRLQATNIKASFKKAFLNRGAFRIGCIHYKADLSK